MSNRDYEMKISQLMFVGAVSSEAFATKTLTYK